MDGHDEYGCKTPSWLLPIILFGTGFIVWCTLFLYSITTVKRVLNDILQIKEKDGSDFERPLFIAILTELGDVDEIKKIFKREIKTHGSEMEAICHLKVKFIYSEKAIEFWQFLQNLVAFLEYMNFIYAASK